MKNIKDLRNLEDLPIDTLSFRLKGKHQIELWNTKNRKSDYHSPFERFKTIWDYVNWYLELNLGKPFDEVFSKFCKSTKQYHQKFFLEEFNQDIHLWYTYYIDENGLIQYYPQHKRQRNLTYKSDDFKQVWKHKILGIIAQEDYSGRPILYSWCNHKGCDHHKCKHKVEDYELVTIKGWSKTFESWADPEFKKLRAIKHRKDVSYFRKRRNAKRKGVDFHTLVENFKDKREENQRWTDLEENRRQWNEYYEFKKKYKEYEENLVKIISHGFDPVNSFRHKLK